MTVPHIHAWGLQTRDSPYACLKCGITRKQWEKQMALKSVEHWIELDKPEGYRIEVGKDSNSTTHLTLRDNTESLMRVFLDDDQRAELMVALMDTENVK